MGSLSTVQPPPNETMFQENGFAGGMGFGLGIKGCGGEGWRGGVRGFELSSCEVILRGHHFQIFTLIAFLDCQPSSFWVMYACGLVEVNVPSRRLYRGFYRTYLPVIHP